MLELTTQCEEVLFLLDKEELKVTEFTVGDIIRLIKLQTPLFAREDVSNLELMQDVNFSRIMCSVKKVETGEYFWPGGIDDFKSYNYPRNMVEHLVQYADELNPIKTNEDTDELDTKKKSS